MGGLLEENLMTPVEDSIDGGSSSAKVKAEGEGAGASADSKSNLIRSLGVANPDNLEARVRRELEEQGILSPGEDLSAGPQESDEILDELKRCQGELRAVSQHNLAQLKRVLQVRKYQRYF